MKKILIVDDSIFMRTILKDLIQQQIPFCEIEIQEANSKLAAMEKMKTNEFDAILLDIVMAESEIEGIEFLKLLTEFYDTKKVIMISSVGQPTLISQCNRLGVNHYLTKPFEHRAVLDIVNKVIL